MPAINPTVLNEKLDALLSKRILVDSFPHEISTILSFYADQTKRSTAAAAALEPTERMRVPAPVLRALCTKIHQRGRTPEDEWLSAAEKIWRSGLQEMQLVSVCMLSEAAQAEMINTASQWAAESDDPRVLGSLASECVQSMRSSISDDLLVLSQGWLAEASTRAFGLLLLRQLFEDASVKELPAVFEQLSGLTAHVRGIESNALEELLTLLAARSPAETAAFLLDEITHGDAKSIRFIRNFNHQLPEPYQSQILHSI
ncbi:MAG: DNA alkylation repair protein [Anaerolineales bacterium]|jgi:hypothetical protein